MKINYSILWFDDQKDFLDSLDTDFIHEEISSWGLIPQIIPVHTPDEFHKYRPFKDLDLIIVDLDLGDDEKGATFIKEVRAQEVYTEIIFYSSRRSAEIWDAIKDEMLEGVFVANKSSGIEQKVVRVAKQSVRKVLDLDNMRGIVMSEVGELDGMLENIFNFAIHGIDQKHMKIVFDKFHEDLDASANSLKESLEAFKNNPSIEGLLDLTDSSEKKWQTFNRIRRHHNVLKGHDLSTQYTQEILSPRNFLAHGIPTRHDDGSFLFKHRGREFAFNDDVSKLLRHKIMEYKRAFEEVASILEEQLKESKNTMVVQ